MRATSLFSCLIIILKIGVGSQFRFDYTFNAKAGGWLKMHVIPANFQNAFRMCKAEGAVLASPLNDGLQEAMTQLHVGSNSESCALITGIHATISKGSFSSIEGVPLSKIRTVWAPDEPDNNKNSEDCLVMLKNGTMADVPCTETYSYVCYKKQTGDIVLNECGTVDDGYKLDSRTGSCYKFHRDAVYWTHAFTICAAEGGYLAIINSDAEAQLLKEMVDKNPENSISSTNTLSTSIGFRDWSDHTMWLTIQGETLAEAGYSHWAPNEPNNIKYDKVGGENCGSILRYGKPGLLNDVPCNVALAFICEMRPNALTSPSADSI